MLSAAVISYVETSSKSDTIPEGARAMLFDILSELHTPEAKEA